MKATLRSCQRFGTLSVGNLIAPDSAPSLSTPRAHWRQLPIKGRGLFHAYLKKHTSQGRTYILNKNDAKMVKDSMRDRVSP